MFKFLRQNIIPIIIGIIFLLFYLLFQLKSIFGGDAGDLVTAAYVFGIAHPPGYPLYILTAGILIRILPFFTPAWRVGLLSSIPSVLGLVIIYLLLLKITANKLISFLGSFILGFSYLFWLYSIVPEVFSLNNFFIILETYLLICFIKNKQKAKYLYLFFLFFGLSFFHHQTSILMIPGFIYLFFQNRRHIRKIGFSFYKAIFLFFSGALPYIYCLFSAKSLPIINWSNPKDIYGLFSLFSRDIYGTFKSGVIVLSTLQERLGNIFLLFDFLRMDFTDIGIILSFAGMYFLYRYKENKQFFYFFLINFLFFGPIFQFYAGFPTANDFGLAIFERFLLPAEIFTAIFITLGIFLFYKRFRPFFYLLAFLPLVYFYFNYPKISILKNDYSAENLGRDILKTCGNGILFLAEDSPLFNSQYVRYGLKEYPNCKVFHHGMIRADYYPDMIRKNYPQLRVPRFNKTNFLKDFIMSNYKNYPIYTNILSPQIKGIFIPEGLLFRYYPEEISLPKVAIVKKRNQALFSQYYDPISFSLYQYKNLMLFDIVRSYHNAFRHVGQYFYTNKDYKEALIYFNKSLKYAPQSFESFYDLGKTHFSLENCQEALNYFKMAEAVEKNGLIYAALEKTYRECLSNNNKADYYLNLYKKIKQSKRISIEEL